MNITSATALVVIGITILAFAAEIAPFWEGFFWRRERVETHRGIRR